MSAIGVSAARVVSVSGASRIERTMRAQAQLVHVGVRHDEQNLHWRTPARSGSQRPRTGFDQPGYGHKLAGLTSPRR